MTSNNISELSLIRKETPNTKIVVIDDVAILVPIWANWIARDVWNNQFTYAYENEPSVCYSESKFIKNGGKRRKVCNFTLINEDFYEQCVKI